MATEFTPFASLFGGILIGIATLVLLLGNGRIAGISGILKSVLPPNPERSRLVESLAFLFGLVVMVPIYQAVSGSGVETTISSNMVLLIVAGLLVGVGVSIGGGCTSGHGVCGLSRLSTRSLVATITFMVAAAITVFILRHVIGG